jgi:hypothetical protein
MNPSPSDNDDSEDNEDVPANERLRRPQPNFIDQRQQQIDPAGHHRRDDNARLDANRKQPGGSDRRTTPEQKDETP